MALTIQSDVTQYFTSKDQADAEKDFSSHYRAPRATSMQRHNACVTENSHTTRSQPGSSRLRRWREARREATVTSSNPPGATKRPPAWAAWRVHQSPNERRVVAGVASAAGVRSSPPMSAIRRGFDDAVVVSTIGDPPSAA